VKNKQEVFIYEFGIYNKSLIFFFFFFNIYVLIILKINNGEYEISSDKFTSDIECFDVNQNFTQSVVGCSDGSLYLNRWLYV